MCVFSLLTLALRLLLSCASSCASVSFFPDPSSACARAMLLAPPFMCTECCPCSNSCACFRLTSPLSLARSAASSRASALSPAALPAFFAGRFASASLALIAPRSCLSSCFMSCPRTSPLSSAACLRLVSASSSALSFFSSLICALSLALWCDPRIALSAFILAWTSCWWGWSDMACSLSFSTSSGSRRELVKWRSCGLEALSSTSPPARLSVPTKKPFLLPPSTYTMHTAATAASAKTPASPTARRRSEPCRGGPAGREPP
mmetsp:Transcript_7481/g.18149  ORF Transcript_7481/g.18149 Transcript_7481/m.18149 type:complete len:262 (+) Transcript_7481:739-1524(+)